MTTLDALFVELKEQAEKLMNSGDKDDHRTADGMMTVLEQLEEHLPNTKPNTKYPNLRKVTMTIIAADEDEAEAIESEMEDSYVAQQGLYTLDCGSIEKVTDADLELLEDEVIDILSEY